MPETTDSPLIDARGLASRLAGDDPPTLLDIRWSLARPDGRDEYLAGHIPGARYVDLEAELSGGPDPARGRHPLPEPADLQASLRRAGVRRDHPVVVYDDASGQSAARAWWLLRWAGHRQVQVLDGGLGAWTAAGGRLEAGTPSPGPEGDVEVKPGQLPSLDTAEVAGRAPDRILVDCRAEERFRGEHEPVDPVAGHIPGAINLPNTGSLDADGRFRSPEALRARFAAVGLGDPTGQPPIVYCGSGVSAAHQLLAMEIAGISGVLYPPSWSGWVSDAAHPVATGA